MDLAISDSLVNATYIFYTCSYSEAIYLQYDINGQTEFLKIAYCVKINGPHLHLGREMGTALYDV